MSESVSLFTLTCGLQITDPLQLIPFFNRYPNKYKLKQHSITHNLHVRPFNCNVCGMTFKMKNLLKRHTMVHTGERPYPCTSCEKRFATQYDLRVRMKFICRFSFNFNLIYFRYMHDCIRETFLMNVHIVMQGIQRGLICINIPKVNII